MCINKHFMKLSLLAKFAKVSSLENFQLYGTLSSNLSSLPTHNFKLLLIGEPINLNAASLESLIDYCNPHL